MYHEEWQLDGGRNSLATNNAVELYNLARDVGERIDLALQQTEKRDELLSDLLEWFDATDALLPSRPNPQYDAAAHRQADSGRQEKSRGKKKKKK